MKCLTTLNIDVLDGNVARWPFYLLTRNYKNLRHLQLGDERARAKSYANWGYFDRDVHGPVVNTNTFYGMMQESFALLQEAATKVLRLESLSLCGFNLYTLIKADVEPVIDFNNLDILRLESCNCLDDAFSELMEARLARWDTLGAPRLRKLVLRHEKVNDAFMSKLQTFLLSLNPLTTLHVLLEGTFGIQDYLHEIVKAHGKSLCSLIWDHRSSARTQISPTTSLVAPEFEELRLVAEHCTALKSLGITLDWDVLKETNEYRARVRHMRTITSLSQAYSL